MKFIIVMATLICVTAIGVRALADKGQDSKAASSFNSGVELFKAEKYEEAVTAFRKAFDLKPSWRIKYNIGQCEAALKRYGQAIEAFEAYLGEGGDEVPIDRRDEVLKDLERMRLMVGSIKVHAQDGVEIFVDEILRGKTPINSGILVTAGVAHWIWFVKDGTKIATFNETIRGGETVDLSAPETTTEPATASPAVETTKPPQTTPAAGAPPAEATVKKEEAPQETPPAAKTDQPPKPVETSLTPSRKKPLGPALFWVGTSATLVFGGATLALALVVESKWKKAEHDVQQDPWDYDSDEADAIHLMQILGYVSMGLGGLGLITAVVAAPFTDWHRGDVSADGLQVSLRPWQASSSGGLLLEGRF